MKKILIAVYIIIILLTIKLFSTFFINENAISKYNKEKYKENLFKKLYFLNISEPYIAYYNDGNVYYQNEDFDKAINNYQKALKLFPPKYKECSIRINLALAMIAQIDETDNSEENKEKAIETLEKAKEVLCENGCAHENDDKGHSKKAERLKKEIEEKIEELQQENEEENEEESQSNDDNDQDNKDQNNEQNEEEQIEEELKEFQEESAIDRQEGREKDYYLVNYEYYRGKKW